MAGTKSPRTGVALPEDLKREAKAAAVMDGKPFYQWVADVVRKELERRKEGKRES